MAVGLPAFAPTLLYAVVLALHLIVPARQVPGYVRDSNGKLLSYRLNGLRVLIAVLALWSLSCYSGLASWSYFYDQRWSSLFGSCILGLIFSFAIVFLAPKKLDSHNHMADFFIGRLENPRVLLFQCVLDVKVVLYLAGAIFLELNVLSATAAHLNRYGPDFNPGVVIYTCSFSFFVVEYLYFEHVHLYTYDFFAEKVGFKLTWGCLCFYPLAYPIGIWNTVDLPYSNNSILYYIGTLTVFVTGWIFARGANMQKFWFKTGAPGIPIDFLNPKIISSKDRKQRLLYSGFWGLSRHVNYLGEILMAIGLTLSLGYPSALLPWLYPLYYVSFLTTRQFDDDQRCAEKYGLLWDDYCKLVPWRIVPFLY